MIVGNKWFSNVPDAVILTPVKTGDCKARHEKGERCVLDRVHNAFGTSHVTRNDEGCLIFWKGEIEE